MCTTLTHTNAVLIHTQISTNFPIQPLQKSPNLHTNPIQVPLVNTSSLCLPCIHVSPACVPVSASPAHVLYPQTTWILTQGCLCTSTHTFTNDLTHLNSHILPKCTSRFNMGTQMHTCEHTSILMHTHLSTHTCT